MIEERHEGVRGVSVVVVPVRLSRVYNEKMDEGR
jgi:hypothetical protein